MKLEIGVSISHKNDYRGTLGAFVKSKSNASCLVSCNHVLAKDGDLIFSKADKNVQIREVLHPGNTLNAAVNNFYIADVEDWSKRNGNGIFVSDSAYARLLNENITTDNIIPNGNKFSGQKIYVDTYSFERQDEGLPIYKIGGATGFTVGRIGQLIEYIVEVENNYYQDLIMVDWLDYATPFSKPGDSGSIAFIEKNGKLYAIGMVFAAIPYGDDKYLKQLKADKIMPFSYLCKIGNILYENDLIYIN